LKDIRRIKKKIDNLADNLPDPDTPKGRAIILFIKFDRVIIGLAMKSMMIGLSSLL